MGWIIFGVVLFLNIVCITTMIFVERKNPQSVLSWSLVMTFLPMIGFILYIFFGNSLSIKTRKMIRDSKIYEKKFKELVINQRLEIDAGELPLREIEIRYKQLIRQNLLISKCALTQNNKVDVFDKTQEMFNSLLSDIKNAKKCINICFYIFATDKYGMQLINLLKEKAQEGVEVNILVDAVGNLKEGRRPFKKLCKYGVRYAEFFPLFLGLKLINLKVNFRNHRKIVIIDNQIAYTGGMNIRADHFGDVKQVAPWTDMHIKIQGDSVMDLQKIFLCDFRYSYKGKDFNEENLSRFFEKPKETGLTGMQVVHSGPNEDEQQIKKAMIKMILSAKSSIVLETPYFVPDETFIEALKIAHASGVDIKIITPKYPDKKIVFYTSLSYLRDMAFSDIKVYQIDGFIHSKCLLIDNELCMIGSCNADIRSFRLNFEISCVIYDKAVASRVESIIQNDLNNCALLDKKWFKEMPWHQKMAKSFFRLFSAIL